MIGSSFRLRAIQKLSRSARYLHSKVLPLLVFVHIVVVFGPMEHRHKININNNLSPKLNKTGPSVLFTRMLSFHLVRVLKPWDLVWIRRGTLQDVPGS